MSQPTRHHNAPTRMNLAFAWVPFLMAFFALLVTTTCLRTAQAETTTTEEEKSTVPVPAKSVRSEAQSSESQAASEGWSSGATAGVGETVSYRITATLPATLRAYNTYTLWLCDELGEGLTYQEDTVVASVVHKDGKSEAVTLDVQVDGQRMRVGSADILASVPGIAPNDTVVVEYDCTVNEKAVQGLSAGNKNALTLEYRRSPTSDEIGATSVKQVTDVYNFELDLHKVGAPDGTSLAGACFVLRNADGEYRTAALTWSKERADAQVTATNVKGVAAFDGLGAGTYTLTETAAPQGYDLLAEPLVVTLNATDLESSERTLTAATTSTAAKVTAVDAGTGVATVEVEDPKSETPAGDKGSDRGNTASTNPGSTSTPNTTTNTGSGSPVSSIVSTVRSALPTTADPLVAGSGAALVVAASLMIIGARRRRSEHKTDRSKGRQ